MPEPKRITNLPELLAERNMTTGDLARVTGKDRITVWRHVNGHSQMTHEDARAYADALQIEIVNLVDAPSTQETPKQLQQAISIG